MKALSLLLLVFLLSLPRPAAARPGPFIIILLPGTSLRGWQAADASQLHHLMATGALAVMNTRTGRLPNDRTRETLESAMLTLGAGARAVGGPEADTFVSSQAIIPDAGLKAAAVYARRMGDSAPPGMAVNLAWPAVLSNNRGRGYDIPLGNLADTLADAGVSLSAGGGRFSVPVAASGTGVVRRAAFLSALPGHCVIWDAGSDLRAADTVLGQAAALVQNAGGRMIVLSPFAGDEEYAQGRRLTPVLEWGPGVPAGLLFSPSTRRSGLVTNTDFAPTIAAYFGQKTMAARPFGQAWTVQSAPRSETRVESLEEQAYRQADGMRLLPYLAVILALWILAGTGMALAGKMPALWPLAPPILLLSALVGRTTAWTLLLFFFSLPVLGLSTRRFQPQVVLTALLSATAAALVLDMVAGSHLMQSSLLGYSAVEGARFYGIGNEAMGTLLGSVLVVAARLWRPAQAARLGLTALLSCIVLLLGSSLAGAKAGGLLVSLAAFGTLLYGLWGGQWSWRAALALLGIVLGVMTVAAVADAVLPGASHSHIGEAVRRIQGGGWAEAGDIAGRKLAVESRLAYHSAWAGLLWPGLLCLGALWKRAPGGVTDLPFRQAGTVAVFTCLALNDAGVVAAALCLVSLWCETVAKLTKEKPLEKDFLQGRWKPLLAPGHH